MEKLSFRQKMSKWMGSLTVQYHRLRGCEIGKNCHISRRAILDRANPKGVHIGNNTRVLLEAMIIAHAIRVVRSKGEACGAIRP